jgi:hypothetical protein
MFKKRWLLAPLLAFACASIAQPENSTIEQRLKSLLAGSTSFDALTVTYTDLHGLWGGLSMTIHGSGKVDQKAVRVKAPPPRKLTKADLRNLVNLLLELKAWEQRVPERQAVPDEGRAYFRIKVGSASSEIWEWYSDMKANDRLIQIRERMQQLAWGKRETGGTTKQ